MCINLISRCAWPRWLCTAHSCHHCCVPAHSCQSSYNQPIVWPTSLKRTGPDWSGSAFIPVRHKFYCLLWWSIAQLVDLALTACSKPPAHTHTHTQPPPNQPHPNRSTKALAESATATIKPAIERDSSLSATMLPCNSPSLSLLFTCVNTGQEV